MSATNPGNRVLLIDAQSGISGDMFVAAAARLAHCEAEVEKLPALLGLAHVRCEFRDVVRSSIRCRKFDVLEGEQPAEGLRYVADDAPESMPARGYVFRDPPALGPAHEHRPLSAIQEMIRRSDLDAPVRDRALRMFERLGQVEAEAHGVPLEAVHFHEIGAIDSIIDITAAALCIERLSIARTIATPVCVGHGTVRTAHGRLPVPAPATEKLLQGIPIVTGDAPGEWTTPTGALILAELQPTVGDPVLCVRDSAAGAGNKDTPHRPNILRLRLAELAASAAADGDLQRDELVAIYCNIDDSTGEFLGADLLELLLRAGARDAVLHPIIMKKGRPAVQLEVLAEPARAESLAGIVLAHTSTIGVRMVPVHRLMLPRDSVLIATPYGDVAAKRVHLPDGTTRVSPEYEACRAVANRAGVPAQTVYHAALASLVRP